MQFDHVSGEKRFGISTTVRKSYEALRAEIAKCEPVCSNCHHIRTQMRLKPEMFYQATPRNYNLQFGLWNDKLQEVP